MLIVPTYSYNSKWSKVVMIAAIGVNHDNIQSQFEVMIFNQLQQIASGNTRIPLDVVDKWSIWYKIGGKGEGDGGGVVGWTLSVRRTDSLAWLALVYPTSTMDKGWV